MSKKKVLLTGAGGFVAGSVVGQAPAEWELHTVSRKPALLERPGLVWHTFDTLDIPSLVDQYRAINPDAVLHAAAIADIDFCKANPNLARQVNVEYSRVMAQLARENGARFVYVSTDNVFDGARGLYTEEDTPVPVNVYGLTKLEGEIAVRECLPDALVARTSIVLGLPVVGMGNSPLSRMLNNWEQGKVAGVPDNETRTPIDVITLGRALIELVDSGLAGIIHLSGNEVVHRCDMARSIATHLGYSAALVEPNDPTGIPGRDERPLDASLSNAKARALLKTPMRDLLEGIDLVLAHKAAKG